jgi:hypothetical protein
MKYFMGLDSGTYTMPDNIRIFNKVGQAYGFMTDCSYVMDTLNKVEFFLSCSMYLNADGILNDGVYEYDQIGFPFFHNLFNAVYQAELSRPKAHLPDLRFPDFSDTALVRPAPPRWIRIDTSAPMAQIEAVLCGLADSMWQDRRLYVNYANLNADEIFYRNLAIALRMRASQDYPFNALRQKNISIASSIDDRFRVFSWDKDSPYSNYAYLRFTCPDGRVLLQKPAEFRENATLPKLIYTQIYQVNNKSGTMYLLLGHTPAAAGRAEYLQAYGWIDDKPEKVQLFSMNKALYADLLVEKRIGKEHIVYDPKRKTITFPMITKSGKKVKNHLVRLKFDGHVFK